jgi:hypothetical protein
MRATPQAYLIFLYLIALVMTMESGSEIPIHFNVFVLAEKGFNRCFPPKSVPITIEDLKSATEVAFSNTDNGLQSANQFVRVFLHVFNTVSVQNVVNLNIKMVLTDA